MPVKQLTKRCWVPSWEGDDRPEEKRSTGPHYGEPTSLPSSDDRPGCAWFHKDCGGVLMFDMSGGFCMRCEAEGVDEPDYEIRKMVPHQLAEPCWYGECSRCGRDLEDDEAAMTHHFTPDEVREEAKAEHWIVGEGGEITCQLWSPGDDMQGIWTPCEPGEEPCVHRCGYVSAGRELMDHERYEHLPCPDCGAGNGDGQDGDHLKVHAITHKQDCPRLQPGYVYPAA